MHTDTLNSVFRPKIAEVTGTLTWGITSPNFDFWGFLMIFPSNFHYNALPLQFFLAILAYILIVKVTTAVKKIAGMCITSNARIVTRFQSFFSTNFL